MDIASIVNGLNVLNYINEASGPNGTFRTWLDIHAPGAGTYYFIFMIGYAIIFAGTLDRKSVV